MKALKNVLNGHGSLEGKDIRRKYLRQQVLLSDGWAILPEVILAFWEFWKTCIPVDTVL